MPADFAMDLSLDLTNYTQIMNALGKQKDKIERINFSDIQKTQIPKL